MYHYNHVLISVVTDCFDERTII